MYERNLPLVVDNPRFLILPWIEIPNLGSQILAIVRGRLPGDWTERYSTTPVLIETFVETPRYTGAVYRASGWTYVGTTQGRGRYDRDIPFSSARQHGLRNPYIRFSRRSVERVLIKRIATMSRATWKILTTFNIYRNQTSEANSDGVSTKENISRAS